MPITFACVCGKRFKADERYAGQTAKCPACGAAVVIPSVAETQPAQEFPPTPGWPPAEAPGQLADITALAGHFRKRTLIGFWCGIAALSLDALLVVVSMAMGATAHRPGGRPPDVPPAVGFLFLAIILGAAVLSVLAIVYSALAMKKENTVSRGQALAGLIIGIVGGAVSTCCLGLVGVGVLAALSRM